MCSYPFITEIDGLPLFDWEQWRNFRAGLFEKYPLTSEHARVELALLYPCKHLKDVPTLEFASNPHFMMGNDLDSHVCFYVSNHWSTIFDVYPYIFYTRPRVGVHEGFKIIAESHHRAPVWGERLCLMSTASDLFDHRCIRYAYFRGRYWLVHAFCRHSVVRDYGSLRFPLPIGKCEIPTTPIEEPPEEDAWLGERRYRVIELDSGMLF